MKVLFDGRFDYPDQIYSYYNLFGEFNDGGKNLLYAYGIWKDDLPEGYKNKIYFNVEEPNGLFHSGLLFHDRVLEGKILSHDWDIIYQMCPYSTKWLNDVLGFKKYRWIPNFPMIELKYFIDSPKVFDIIYSGGLHGYKREYSQCIDIMTKYKYIWTSLSDEPDSRKTHIKIPYTERIKLVCQTKLTVVDNLLYEPYPGAFSNNIKKLPKWNENEAFSHIQEGILPQFKVKLMEHMLGKGLCLIKKTPWDLMEKMGFEENEHFLYFDDYYELDSLISECLNNWDVCEKIAENAHAKILSEDTIEAFYMKHLKPYDI